MKTSHVLLKTLFLNSLIWAKRQKFRVAKIFLEAWMPFRLLANHKNLALGDLKCWVSDLTHLAFLSFHDFSSKHRKYFFVSHSFPIFVIFISLLHNTHFNILRLCYLLAWIDISVSIEKENFKEHFLNSVILGAKKPTDLLFAWNNKKLWVLNILNFTIQLFVPHQRTNWMNLCQN